MFDDLIPHQVDFNRPIADVRADIAKIPEGPQRDKAMKAWADAYVAKERAPNPDIPTERVTGSDGKTYEAVPAKAMPLNDVVRNVARGTLIGSFADELEAATEGFAHTITGGRIGAPYEENVAYQRALDRALDKEPGSTATQFVGALASGAPIAKAVLGTGKTLPGKVWRGGTLLPARCGPRSGPVRLRSSSVNRGERLSSGG
jgi:hypothetical protein